MQCQNFLCKSCNPTIFNPDYHAKCVYCSNRVYRVNLDSVVVDCQATEKNMRGYQDESEDK